MKTKILISTTFIILTISSISFAGNKVDGAKIALFQPSNQEFYAMIHTNEDGEFAFFDIPPGNYILTISIPKRTITDDLENRKILSDLIDGGCDKSQGRMVFKIKDQCFIYDINCEKIKNSTFLPSFNISEIDNNYYISIATAYLKETTLIKGMFQSLSAKSYKRCLASGKFYLVNEADPIP
jgi:hypothetical protein